jgi:hypothetical protein
MNILYSTLSYEQKVSSLFLASLKLRSVNHIPSSRFEMEIIIEENDMGRVAQWLEEIEIEATETVQAEPRTPPRRPHETLLYAEVSPTDTTFSGACVFDKPFGPLHELDHLGHHRDDVSDATSLDENEEKPLKDLTSNLETCSLHDHQQDSVSHDKPRVSATPVLASPRLTTIVSCLQCTLLHLPCSRTPPSCTRCIRNNRASSCLLQRRLFTDEIAAQLPDLCNIPVLLKLADEDERTWTEKMKAKEELLQVWRVKRDRENWVAPKVHESKRGGWNKYGRVKSSGVGISEGMGGMTFMELVVDGEVVRI